MRRIRPPRTHLPDAPSALRVVKRLWGKHCCKPARLEGTDFVSSTEAESDGTDRPDLAASGTFGGFWGLPCYCATSSSDVIKVCFRTCRGYALWFG